MGREPFVALSGAVTRGYFLVRTAAGSPFQWPESYPRPVGPRPMRKRLDCRWDAVLTVHDVNKLPPVKRRARMRDTLRDHAPTLRSVPSEWLVATVSPVTPSSIVHNIVNLFHIPALGG